MSSHHSIGESSSWGPDKKKSIGSFDARPLSGISPPLYHSVDSPGVCLTMRRVHVQTRVPAFKVIIAPVKFNPVAATLGAETNPRELGSLSDGEEELIETAQEL